MKILIPVDGSEYSKVVIDEAAQRQWKEGDEFRILCVVAVPSEEHWSDWGLSVSPEHREQLTKDATRLMEDTVATLRPQLGRSTKIDGTVVHGHAVDCILDVATSWPADVIMMGSHGRTGLRKLVLGSVAEEVLMKSPCTVEIVRDKQKHEEGAKMNSRPKFDLFISLPILRHLEHGYNVLGRLAHDQPHKVHPVFI